MAKTRKMKIDYVTVKDIVIPAGTRVAADGPKTSYTCERASILVAESKDCTSEWSMPLDEALELGLIKAAG